MSDASTINCPKCAASMVHIQIDDVTIDHCTRCAGFWLDALELDRLRAAGAARSIVKLQPASAQPGPRKPMQCPRDNARLIDMALIDQPHIRYEACNTCGGMFLDGAELPDALRFTLAERLRALLGR
jgi:Zn-finger nucleic acid-binding protein